MKRLPLTLLTTLRNDILHFGPASIEFRDGLPLIATISNERATLPNLARTIPISAYSLDHYAVDLGIIMMAFICFRFGDDFDQDVRDGMIRVAMQPWRYTPPPPAQSQKQRPEKRQGKQRQPRSSQG